MKKLYLNNGGFEAVFDNLKESFGGDLQITFNEYKLRVNSKWAKGEITGMYLIDEEGTLETRDVNARFVNGKPEAIESVYIMKSPEDWDRFMRFMERYGQTNGLVFTKAT